VCRRSENGGRNTLPQKDGIREGCEYMLKLDRTPISQASELVGIWAILSIARAERRALWTLERRRSGIQVCHPAWVSTILW